MPLLNPRPNDPELLARLSAHQLNRTCLQQQVLHVHGKHFDETRTWCVKMQHWDTSGENPLELQANIAAPRSENAESGHKEAHQLITHDSSCDTKDHADVATYKQSSIAFSMF